MDGRADERKLYVDRQT